MTAQAKRRSFRQASILVFYNSMWYPERSVSRLVSSVFLGAANMFLADNAFRVRRSVCPGWFNAG